MSGTKIDIEALKSVSFSEHNHMRFAVVDEAGKVIKTGRDLNKLKGGVERTTSKKLQQQATKTIEREGIKTWDFGQQGLRRLYMLAESKNSNYLLKNLPNISKLCLNYASTGSCDELTCRLLTASAFDS